MGKFLAWGPRRAAFDPAHQAMDTVLRVDLLQEVDMVWPVFEGEDFRCAFRTYLLDNRL